MAFVMSANNNSKGKDIPDHDPELQKVWEELDQLSGDELRRKYAEFAKQFPQQMLGGKPADEIDIKPPRIPHMEVPDEGRVKEWGANPAPRTWKVVEMKNKGPKGQILYKVVDDKDINVADNFTSIEKAGYFIKYYIETHAVPSDKPGTKPDVPDEAVEGEEPEPPAGEQPAGGEYTFPIPQGFTPVGEFSTAFKHWGRHETNYASGGAGPSERWDNIELPDIVNLVSGYEFIIGPEHGKRGSDNVDLKTHANGHNDKCGGWLIAWISWEEDGSDGEAGWSKEFPHPVTSHLKFNVEGADVKVKNIKDGKKHGFLMAKFLDAKKVPTIMLWYNELGTGKIEDYVYLGKAKDDGTAKPGPVFDVIGKKGVKKQSLQVRIDEIPNARIMSAFAVEVQPPPDA